MQLAKKVVVLTRQTASLVRKAALSVDGSSVGRLRWSVRPVGHFLCEIDNRWEVVGIAVEPHASAMRTQRVAFVLSLLLDKEIAVEHLMAQIGK